VVLVGRGVSRRRPRNVALAAGAGYLLGTIPWAGLAARRASAGRVDLRAVGSGNPGALNAIQVLGKRWGYAIGIADIAKGAAACIVGRAIAGDAGAHVGGTAAVVGHCYPVWSGFRGGKGVATAIGQCLATFPAALPAEVVAGLVGIYGPFERHSLVTAELLAATWVATGLMWSRTGWPNPWGPRPTVALPVSAAVSSAIVLHRFATQGPAPTGMEPAEVGQ
jgi:acyl phosphate:glycerol-3-phosphate acyltransferase